MDNILSEGERRSVAPSLFTACIVDFMFHLMNRPEPMIIGGNYPRDKIVNEFEKWTAARKLNFTKIDTELWNNLWKSGLLQ